MVRGALASALLGCRPKDEGRAPDGPVDTGTAPSRPPNIVLVFSDQHRGTFWRANGHPVVLHPNLDRLAADAVSFTNLFTNGPSCRPARATMMTGRYVHEHGVWDNYMILDPAVANHVRDVRLAGYETAVIGKTHLHDDRTHTSLTTAILDEFGFEYVHELVGQSEQTWHETPYSDWLTATTPAGEVDKYERYIAYVEQYTWSSRAPDTEPWFLTTTDHLDRYTGQIAADWLRARNDPRPFYLQVNFPGPHKPFDATMEYRDLYSADDPNLPPAIDQRPVNPGRLVQTLLEWKEEDFSTEQARLLQVQYLAKISLVDAGLGMVLDALEELGLLEDTWIVYASDHGELLGDHHLTGKIAFYEGAIRVPLVVRPPGGTAPWVAEGYVDLTDLPATLRAMAGLAPDGTAPGRSLLERIAGGAGAPDAQEGRAEIVSQNMWNAMIRTPTHKLTYDIELAEPAELFDLQADPDELVNVIDDPAMASVKQDLLARLVAAGSPESVG